MGSSEGALALCWLALARYETLAPATEFNAACGGAVPRARYRSRHCCSFLGGGRGAGMAQESSRLHAPVLGAKMTMNNDEVGAAGTIPGAFRNPYFSLHCGGYERLCPLE
jgi:hypothetical protein